MEPYKELEEKYAAFAGSTHAVSCSSGTAALHLSLLAFGVGAGDEVIVPDFCMAACAFAVSYCNATPVFVDVLPDTYALDPALLEVAITPRTKAIIVVHTYGRLADMDAIIAIAKRHSIPVIEDACEAQGAVHASKADVTVYSFFRNKIIPAEEGGLITTESEHIVERANFLKSMAFNTEHDYFHTEIGYNYRMPDAEAVLALASLRAYEANVAKRTAIEAWYDQYLTQPMPKRDAVWFYEVNVPSNAKEAILAAIPRARHSFKPLSSLPMYGSGAGKPVSRALSESLLLLPAWTDLIESDVRDIAERVNGLI
ncbi:MAG: DegT/DnrJ/EryC1/StrS aminotransferase [Parcubacteria group bacterium]|jgi:dTDP-4-amino-4,6-dideoxygalactose transaminase|nr:DegT/DnrJ/EryC1/StrS aminotransferase [Parcubacteria group bacterium]